MLINRLHFEYIRINANGDDVILTKIFPMVCKGWSIEGMEKNPEKKTGIEFLNCRDYKKPGYARNCHFKNISLTGNYNTYRGIIYVAGNNEKYNVRNVTFENINRFGELVFADSPEVIIGSHADNIKFINK